MKKTLLAAALLTGFAGAASAQSSVTLYGLLDVGVEYQNLKSGNNYAFTSGSLTKNSMTRVGLASGQTAGSRWGLKGVEDLGNGLKANFVYEAGVNVASGASTNFTRQATLGLNSSKWGAVDLGRRVSAGTQAFSGIDPFGASWGTSALDSSMGSQYIRYSNQIAYATPNISGFTGLISYSFDTGLAAFGVTPGATAPSAVNAPFSYETNNKTRAVSVGLRYANGPLLVSAIWDQLNAPASANLNSSKVNAWSVGGTYDFKVAKLHAAYGQQIGGIVEGTTALSNAGISGGVSNTNGGVLFAGGARTQSWMVGASAPIGGATRVIASVQQMLPGGTFKTATNTATQTVASIGVTYELSKRTNLYGYYSYVNNYAMLDGVKANTVGAGVRHQF